MIRKPTERDFQEGEAVKALRETRKITVEGSKGIGAGIGRVYTTYLAISMGAAFCLSLVAATGGIALIPMVIGGVWWLNRRKDKEAAERHRLRDEQERIAREAQARRSFASVKAQADPADIAFPPDVRRHGVIEADIATVIGQAFALLLGALLVLFVFAIVTGLFGVIVGCIAMMLAALIGSRAFGHRKLIEWDTRKVKVWHLLGEGEMQWADVTEVTVEKSSRFNLLVYFLSGSRRNIVIRALVNRLDGPLELRVPIRHMNLDEGELQRLLRDLMCWRAAGHAAAPEQHAPIRQQAYGAPVTPLTDPRESFDPDAIMARYLREREETLAAAGREDIAPHRPRAAAPSPIDNRPVFGRKRA